MGLVQGTPGVTLSNVTLPIMFYWINISKIPPLNYIFSIFFTHTHIHTHQVCYQLDAIYYSI